MPKSNTRVLTLITVAVASLLSAHPLRAAGAAAAPGKAKPIAVAKLDRSTPVDFEKEILPVLNSNCLACHNKTKAKADLVLETPADIRKGGENGPAVVAGKSGESLMLKAASHTGEQVMPPPGNKVAASDLTPEQLGLIRLWIDQGATGEVRGPPPVAWQAVPADFRPIYAVAVTPDGKYAACGRANRIDVYHLPTKRLVARLSDPTIKADGKGADAAPAHRDMVESLAFSPDGKVLASGSYREVKLWLRPEGDGPDKSEKSDKSEKPAKPEKTEKDKDVAKAAKADSSEKSKDADKEKAKSEDPTAADVPSWPLDRTLGGGAGDSPSSPFADRVAALCFSPDGKHLATGGGVPSRSGEIRLWEVATGRLEKSLDEVHSDAVLGLSFSPDGKRLASGSADKWVRVTDLSTGKVEQAFEGHTHHVLGVSWKRDGKTIVSGGADNTVRFWPLDPAAALDKRKPVAGFEKEVTSVTYLGAGDSVLCTSGDGKVKAVKETKDGDGGGKSFPGPSDFVYSGAASADGSVVVAGGQDGVLRVWDGAGKEVATFGAGEKK